MADDGDDWFGGADDGPAEPTPLKKPGAPDSAGAAAAGDAPPGDAPAEGEESRPEAEAEPIDPDRVILFKHWIRPKFLQYRYLHDYRQNYYNDVIDYLDKRQKGVSRDIPRAETWAERALRSYNSNITRSKYFRTVQEDTMLCTNIRLGGRFHLYHSKEYFNRRYSSLL